MKISNKKIYILGAATILLILIIILPLFNSIRKSSQELFSQKKELALFQQKEKELENIREKYKAYQESLGKIDNLLVDPALPIELISFLEKSALDSKSSIKVASTREIAGPEPALSFNTTFSGSFSNLLKFINRLENGPYLIEIINLNIKKLGQEQPGNITANLELMVLAK
jgi:hypothetical protein